MIEIFITTYTRKADLNGNNSKSLRATYPSARNCHQFLCQIVSFGHVADLHSLIEIQLAGKDQVVNPVAGGIVFNYFLSLLPVNFVAVNGLTPKPFTVDAFIVNLDDVTLDLERTILCQFL